MYANNFIKKISIASWLAIAIYFLGVLVPMIYTHHSSIPENIHLKKSDGVLIFNKLRKGDSKIGINIQNGDLYFTCSAGLYGGKNWCLSMGDAKALIGKPAEIWWFNQKIYPFVTQKRLVRLMVNGQEIIGVARTLERQRVGASYLSISAIFIFIFVLFGIFNYDFKK